MGQICDLERVQPQEIPFKVCVMFYNAFSVTYHYIISYIETVERKKSFLAIIELTQMYDCRFFNGGWAESDINQYAVQKTLTDVFGSSLLLLEISCFRNIVLPYHLRMLLNVFMRR